jgi:hypothetical protein
MRSLPGEPMPKKNAGKCLSCHEVLVADVRNRGRQKYCSKPGCRRAAKAARQARWLQKPQNQDYFCGPEHVQRVREWRALHPGYWRSHRRARRIALQDALTTQPTDHSEVLASFALQDALQQQGPVLLGLISRLTESTLQDALVNTTRGLLQLGQDILSGATDGDQQTRAAP